MPCPPQERLQNKIVITRKCLPEAVARGSPQERLQNKIIITRKCLPKVLARGSPQERLQNKIVMPSKGSGQGASPGEAPEQDC